MGGKEHYEDKKLSRVKEGHGGRDDLTSDKKRRERSWMPGCLGLQWLSLSLRGSTAGLASR